MAVATKLAMIQKTVSKSLDILNGGLRKIRIMLSIVVIVLLKGEDATKGEKIEGGLVSILVFPLLQVKIILRLVAGLCQWLLLLSPIQMLVYLPRVLVQSPKN